MLDNYKMPSNFLTQTIEFNGKLQERTITFMVIEDATKLKVDGKIDFSVIKLSSLLES